MLALGKLLPIRQGEQAGIKVIDGILAEWFSRQDQNLQQAYFTNGVAYASMETMRAQLTHLWEALRAEGLHVFYCRRVVLRMLYGVPEPEGVSPLIALVVKEKLSLDGKINPADIDAFTSELVNMGVGIRPPQRIEPAHAAQEE